MAATVGAAGYSSQQPAQYIPSMSNVPAPTRVWLTTGNTDVVTDAAIHPTSFVDVAPLSNPAGFWKVVCSQGSMTITSSSSESAGLQYQYRVN